MMKELLFIKQIFSSYINSNFTISVFQETYFTVRLPQGLANHLAHLLSVCGTYLEGK